MRKFILLISILLLPFLASAEGWEFQKPPLGVEVDWSNPITEGLVGCWLFNEGGGDKVYDSSGNGNTGTLTNMAFPSTIASGWNSGKDGIGLKFDGSNDYISVDDTSSIGDGVQSELTIVMGFKPRVALTQDGNVHRMLEKGDCYFFLQGDGHFLLGNGGMNFLVKRGNTLYTAEIKQTLNANQEYFIVGTFDGTHISVYLDNIWKDTTSVGGKIDDDKLALKIGADDSGKYFNGFINFVYIYNRFLSSQAHGQLYINPYGMFKRMEVSLIKSLAVAAKAPQRMWKRWSIQ